MTAARLSGRAAGGSTGPGVPFLLAWTGFGWSDGMLYRVDALPGGDDVVGPGPGGGDLEGSAASAADEAADLRRPGAPELLQVFPFYLACHFTLPFAAIISVRSRRAGSIGCHAEQQAVLDPPDAAPDGTAGHRDADPGGSFSGRPPGRCVTDD
jgi:hypothetical protein